MRRGSVLLALSLAFALAAQAPSAKAAYDPLGSGQTKLALNKSFLSLLAQNGVKLSAAAPAKLKGGTVRFPISGGKFDPTSSNGVVVHEGALVFKAGSRDIPLKALQLKTTQRRSPLSAKVGGSQLKLATAKSLTVSRQGFGDTVKVAKLALSAKLATRLAKKLRLGRGVLKAGQPLGSAATVAQPETVKLLPRNRVSLTFDPGFQAKLNSLFVAVNPIYPVEHPGPFTLPIAGGEIAPNGSQGAIETAGSLEFLQQGGGQVFWAESRLDLAAAAFSPEVEVAPSPPFGGKFGPLAVADLRLAGARIAPNPKGLTVAVEGAGVALRAETATVFNEVFAKPQGKDGIFLAGEAVGSVSFVAQGQ